MTQFINYYAYDPITRQFDRVIVRSMMDPMPTNSVIDEPPARTSEWSRIGNQWIPTPPAAEPEEPAQGSLL